MSTPAAVIQCRLKYAATINDEALAEDTDPDYELQYVDIGNVDSSGCVHEIATYRFCDAPSRARRQVRNGDVIISTVRTYLQAIAPIQQPPHNLIVSTGFAVVRPRTSVFDAGFCKYALREPAFLVEVEMRSVGVSYPAINASDLGSISIYLPPPPEQRAVANYLDCEIARLDGLVAAKERVLGLLAEKRRALITRAVTRGLDPRAPFRDSGIPWLGEIPAHWKVIQLKFVTQSLQTGPFGSQLHAEEYITGGIPVVNPSHLKSGRICADDRISVDEATAERLVIHRLFQRDVVFARRGELGRCGIVESEQAGWLCGTGSLRARLRTDLIDPYYLALVFTETRVSDVLTFESVGSTMDNLNTEILGSCQFGMPPLTEQRVIVAHIAIETAKQDALRAATERTIALLKERRAALIAAAVTGQLPIREATGLAD